MKTYNLSYETHESLKIFLENNQIINSSQILCQVFTSGCSVDCIKNITKSINILLPDCKIIGTTTDGEITNGVVSTNKTTLSITIFEESTIETFISDDFDNYKQAGEKLAKNLNKDDLKVIITFIDGLLGNGEDYLDGIKNINKDITVSGGSAGDNGLFEKTYVFSNDKILQDAVVGVGIYSKNLNVHTEYKFDWVPIGRELTITRCDNNRVYEIENKSAYDTYKYYFGEEIAMQLPTIGIEFPLIIQRDGMQIARAVLKNNMDGSLTFGGNFKVGDKIKFGYGDSESILSHTHNYLKRFEKIPVESIFLYSCMARRRFLEDEIEFETKPYNTIAPTSGFFSYGEFYTSNDFHYLNETMSVLALSESNKIEERSLLEIDNKEKNNSSLKALSHLVNVTSKEINEQNEDLKKFFYDTIDPIIILENSRIIDCNNSAVNLFEINSKDELINKNITSFSSKSLNDKNKELNKKLILDMENSSKKFEWIFTKNNGMDFHAKVSLTKLILSNKKVTHMVIRDNTLQKEMQNNLIQLKDEALEASKIKDDFLANMSHELKTPLNSINIISNVMKNNKSGNLNEKDIKNLEIINKSGHFLLHMINDVLDLSKLEAGDMDLNIDKIDVKDTFLDLLDMFTPQFENTNINLLYEIDDSLGYIYSDDVRLKQIVKNFLSNSLKFTQKGSVKLIVQDDMEFIKIIVKDEGIGIPQNKLDYIFDRFKQADESTTRKYGGTGLGLAISKELVELLKGDIEIESVVDKGTSITVRIPKNNHFESHISNILIKKENENENIKKIEDKKSEKSQEDIKNLKKSTILVLNSDPSNFFDIIISLQKSYIVKQVFNIESLLKKIDKLDEYLKIIIDISSFSGTDIIKIKKYMGNKLICLYNENKQNIVKEHKLKAIKKSEIKDYANKLQEI